MTQLALWLGLATIVLAVVTFLFFALRAKRLGVHPFYSRGHSATAGGIGIIGVGLVLIASHSARTTGPDGVSWLGVLTMAVGAALWIIGEIWERRAKKAVETLQRIVTVAEESRARMERNAEEPRNSP